MLKKLKNSKSKKVIIGSIIAVVMIIAVTAILVIINNQSKSEMVKEVSDPELARAMTYDQFERGDDDIEGTDNVKFSAFFLRDINSDGDAEKIKGTCKQVGCDDTLYMEINVQTEGMLKNGKIEIDGKNFYLKTAAPKDDQLKENYISENTKIMEFNDIESGTQKLMTGTVRSGDYTYSSTKANAIGGNINNLSRDDNKIIFTGTYVNENNEETEIRKEITLETDWYGTTYAYLYKTYYKDKELDNGIDTVGGTVTLALDFTVEERNKELNVKYNYVEGNIPQLNGYDPLSVTCNDSANFFYYDENTKMFTIDREAVADETTGKITSSISSLNYYTIKVKYPIEAIDETALITSVSMKIMTYFDGYNNPNDEFQNPYRSNEATKEITWNFVRKR